MGLRSVVAYEGQLGRMWRHRILSRMGLGEIGRERTRVKGQRAPYSRIICVVGSGGAWLNEAT